MSIKGFWSDEIWSVIESEDRNFAVVDIIFTGEHKNRHCFKTIYIVQTGEILYLNDDASLYGKKQGLIEDDLKTLERARWTTDRDLFNLPE